ncbi:zinc-binding dehydrogenase, partial [Klebsiella pneumoniae]
SRSIPAKFAAFKDALGNAVHTAYAGPLEGQNLLITGMGPIGLMAVAVAKAAGAAKVVAVEPSLYRINLARQMGADLVISPR